MLPRSRRISRSDFPLRKEQHSFVKTELFIVRRYRRSDKKTLFTIIVPKRLAPSAVLRNRVKRRFYAVIELHMAAFEASSYGRYIFTLNTAASKVQVKGITSDINNILKVS